MKSCQKYRKQIAWLAMESLEARHEPELRAHIDDCADCQKYFIETRSIAGKLRAAEPEPSVEPSPSFHRRVVDAVADTERRSVVELLFTEFGSRWNWRLAFPAAALMAMAIAAWVVTSQRAGIHHPSPVASATSVTREVKADLAPTVSNYELAARQSLDKLDELLTDQGFRNSSAPAAFTAGQLFRATIVN